MQNTKGEWSHAIKRLYSRRNFINYDKSVEIVRKLGYPDFYNRNTTILDIYSGAAVFSAALHNEIKPKTHVLMEPYPHYRKFLDSLADPPRIYSEVDDPYRWSTFKKLIDEGKFIPESQDRSHVHNELLFTGNLLHTQGEQLVTQYLNCISNQSWIERYGRVRLLLWMRAKTAEKLLAGPGEKFRNRVACQRESCADARVVLHASEKSGDAKYPVLLKNPLITDWSSTDDFAGSKKIDLSLVELTPYQDRVEHLDEFEYVIKMLFILRATPLEHALNSLGPGAVEDLGPQLSDLLHLKPTDLSLGQFMRITEVFWRWPFKPEILMDFYEESNLGLGRSGEM